MCVKWLILVALCASCQVKETTAKVSYPNDNPGGYMEQNRQQRDDMERNRNNPAQQRN